MDKDTIEGGCLCGALRSRIAGLIRWTVHCHCSLCRRAAGAPLVTWSTVAADDFTFTKGRPAQYRATPAAVRQYCVDCGSQLTFQHKDLPDEIDVTTSSLDEPDLAEPQRHIWTASGLGWFADGADGLPRFPEDSP